MTAMLLCIDIGNTNTVLATFEDDKLVHSWRVKTDARATADEMGLMFRGLLADDIAGRSGGYRNGPVELTGVAACSTVPAALRSLRTMLGRYYSDIPAVIVEPGVRTGVQLAIDNPKEVGSDRVANTLAAYTLYGGPSIVVDFGTSTNFDVVSSRGEFLGGVLAPGIEISVDALAARAAQLRKVELVKPARIIGKNTVECLQSGVVYGFAGQVDGVVRGIISELGPVNAVVATGGLAPIVIDECATVTHYEPWLTLIGLRLIFERNLPVA
jgi:type III pantothenate kinase